MEVRAPRTNERPPYIRMKRQAGSYVDDARTEPPAAAAIIRPERQKTRRSRVRTSRMQPTAAAGRFALRKWIGVREKGDEMSSHSRKIRVAAFLEWEPVE